MEDHIGLVLYARPRPWRPLPVPVVVGEQLLDGPIRPLVHVASGVLLLQQLCDVVPVLLVLVNAFDVQAPVFVARLLILTFVRLLILIFAQPLILTYVRPLILIFARLLFLTFLPFLFVILPHSRPQFFVFVRTLFGSVRPFRLQSFVFRPLFVDLFCPPLLCVFPLFA